MFKRLINLFRSWFGFGLDKLENPDILLDQARREMQELHQRNRERAVQAITQKNNLQQMVEDLQRTVDNLQSKAEFALKRGERDVALQLLKEKQSYEESLSTTKESLAQAIETAEQVKVHIKQEEEKIRRKTAEAMQLKAQWKSAQIQNDIEKQLSSMGQLEDTDSTFGRAAEKVKGAINESKARAELGKTRVESRIREMEESERDLEAEQLLADLEMKMGLSSTPAPTQTATASADSDIERQLAELEAKVGGNGNTPGSGTTS